MKPINLSYVLTTRNKLPYLKELLTNLIAAKQDDEEILIADGASTDGTTEYLQGLLAEKKIDFLISEADKGEAHGFNKVISHARGEVIKLITDDDAFYFEGIERCKEYMLAHPEVDFLSTDGIKRRTNTMYPFIPMLYQSRFETLQKHRTPFAFCGLGIMIRRSSLPLLGYLHTGFMRVDAEYALRVTSSKACLAWYTGETFAHILNANSNSVTQSRKISDEMELLEALYLHKPTRSPIMKSLRTFLRTVRDTLKRRVATPAPEPHAMIEDWNTLFHTSVEWLKNNGKENPGTFLIRK